MIDFAHEWDPTNGLSWARLLGMVHVPMFATRKTPKAAEEAAILLDGSRGSFAFLRTEDTEFAEAIEPLSWSWSSCVRHIVTVLPNKERMYVRRWDDPHIIRKFEPPKQGMGAFSLLETLEAEAEPRRPNVVRRVLEPFRQIRLRLNVKEPLLAVKFLNGLLLVADAAKKQASKKEIEAIKTFDDAFKLLSEKERRLCGLVDIPTKLVALKAGNLIQNMVPHKNLCMIGASGSLPKQ